MVQLWGRTAGSGKQRGTQCKCNFPAVVLLRRGKAGSSNRHQLMLKVLLMSRTMLNVGVSRTQTVGLDKAFLPLWELEDREQWRAIQ